MKPYVVLGTYTPKKPWRAWRIGRDLCRLTKAAGLVPINDPKHRHQTKAAWCDITQCAYVRRRTVRNPKAAGWHQDGDLVAGSEMDNCVVLWCSNTPTQFRVGGVHYEPKAREVILVRNSGLTHRRNPDAPRMRYLFRQRVEMPTHIEVP